MQPEFQTFSTIDHRSANPFWMSENQKNVALRFLPFLLVIWLFFLLGFKTEISSFGDEGVYHNGGLILASSLAKGTFLKDVFDKDMFKYPGYYGFAGVTYFLFGENPLLVRVFGIIPLLGLSLIIANMASLIAGERARNFAMLSIFFSPILFFFSIMLLRDIYILFGVGLVLHTLIAIIQLHLPFKKIFSIPALLGLGIIYLMRFPMIAISLIVVIISLLLSWALSLSLNRRRLAFILVTFIIVGALYFAYLPLVDLISQTFFAGQELEASISSISYLSDYSFRTANEMITALFDPKFFVITIFSKLNNITLGAHPFLNSHNDVSLFNLISNFKPESWGGYKWEDVLLTKGLQWMVHFLLLPYFIAGFVGILRFNRKVLIPLFMLWITYAFITIFTGNDERWGLPIMLVYYVIISIGYGLYGNRLKKFFVLTYGLLIGVVAVRILGYQVPMLVVPIFLCIVFLRQKINPVDLPESNGVPPVQSREFTSRDHIAF